MTVLGSVITFGGYQFPIGAILKARQVDQQIDETQMLGRDGTYAASGTALAQIVTVEIGIGGGDWSPFTNAQMLTLDDANDESNRIYGQLALGYQQLVVGETPARYLYAQKQHFKVEYPDGSYRSHATMTIDFYAADPRWLSLSTHTVNPIDNTATTITNAGTVRAYPEFNFVGPSSGNPSADITPSSSAGSIGFTCNVILALGDILTVNCDPRANYDQRVMLNGANRMDLLGTSGLANTVGDDYFFPYLDPGDNSLIITGSSDPGSYIAWSDAYGL